MRLRTNGSQGKHLLGLTLERVALQYLVHAGRRDLVRVIIRSLQELGRLKSEISRLAGCDPVCNAPLGSLALVIGNVHRSKLPRDQRNMFLMLNILERTLGPDATVVVALVFRLQPWSQLLIYEPFWLLQKVISSVSDSFSVSTPFSTLVDSHHALNHRSRGTDLQSLPLRGP